MLHSSNTNSEHPWLLQERCNSHLSLRIPIKVPFKTATPDKYTGAGRVPISSSSKNFSRLCKEAKTNQEAARHDSRKLYLEQGLAHLTESSQHLHDCVHTKHRALGMTLHPNCLLNTRQHDIRAGLVLNSFSNPQTTDLNNRSMPGTHTPITSPPLN